MVLSLLVTPAVYFYLTGRKLLSREGQGAGTWRRQLSFLTKRG
jgi:hypothetical protein